LRDGVYERLSIWLGLADTPARSVVNVTRPKTANPQCFSTASAPAGWATFTQGSDSSNENGEVFHG
jgi:hypothetical protein